MNELNIILEKLVAHIVDYGKIELGTDQSKLLIQAYELSKENNDE